MSYFTGLALRRRPVTILTIILIMALGVYVYTNFQRELFPEIEFPNITIITIYPDSDPSLDEIASNNCVVIRTSPSRSNSRMPVALVTFTSVMKSPITSIPVNRRPLSCRTGPI